MSCSSRGVTYPRYIRRTYYTQVGYIRGQVLATISHTPMATAPPPRTFVTGGSLNMRCYGGWDIFTHDVANRRAPECWTLAFVMTRTGRWAQHYECILGGNVYRHTQMVGVTVLATIDGCIIRLVCSNSDLVGAFSTRHNTNPCILQVRDAFV